MLTPRTDLHTSLSTERTDFQCVVTLWRKTYGFCVVNKLDKTRRLSLHRRLSYLERRGAKFVLERPLRILTHGLSFGNGRHLLCFVYIIVRHCFGGFYVI